MSIDGSIEAIKLLATGIEKHINSLNVMYNDNLYEYKLKDFLNIDKAIKVCSRCGNVFIPKFGFGNTQQYCSDDCRYNSTKATRKVIKQDEKYHKIDCLRKLIYEQRYRAKRDNKPISDNKNKVFEIGESARKRTMKYFDRKIMLENQRKDYSKLLKKRG